MKHGFFVPSGEGVTWFGKAGQLLPAASLLYNRGSSAYYKLGKSVYRFEGYKSSILKLLLSDTWRLARFIISDGKGFTGDDEYGTNAKLNPTICVKGGQVGEAPGKVVIGSIQSGALSMALAGSSAPLMGAFGQVLDAKSAIGHLDTATDISGKLTDMSDGMEAPDKKKTFMDHRLNKRIQIDVDCYMSTGSSKFASKVVDTHLEEINFGQLAAVVAGLP